MERVAITGLRIPITGLRIPITGLRVPIHLGEPLDWDEQFAKFENYIKFAAKQTFEGTPNSFYSSEDLYQEGLLLMWQCFEKYKYKPEKEFQYLFKSSLWRKLREKVNKPNLETNDIDGLYDSEDIGYTEDNLDDIFEEYRMKQVRELLSGNPTALVILEELVNPSEVTMNECDKDRSRKEMLKNQGKIIQLATTVEITGTHIQRALHLSEEVYKENFKLIQGAIYEVYSRDTDIKNYIPDLNWFYDTLDKSNIVVDTPALTDEEVSQMVDSMEFDAQEITDEKPITTVA